MNAWEIGSRQIALDTGAAVAHKQLSTCPACHMRWRTDGDVRRDFSGPIYCPDCYVGSGVARGLASLRNMRVVLPARERDR